MGRKALHVSHSSLSLASGEHHELMSRAVSCMRTEAVCLLPGTPRPAPREAQCLPLRSRALGSQHSLSPIILLKHEWAHSAPQNRHLLLSLCVSRDPEITPDPRGLNHAHKWSVLHGPGCYNYQRTTDLMAQTADLHFSESWGPGGPRPRCWQSRCLVRAGFSL